MPSLYIDATEARTTSRLPSGVIQAAEIVGGLEEFTGADMLLSPLNEPKLPPRITDIIPHQSALKLHCQAGILVQRKTGLDFIHSIPDLKVSLYKMKLYTDRPYLLSIGYLDHKDGIATIDEQMSVQRTSYMEVMLAIEKWLQRGGIYLNLLADSWIAPWINLWLEKLLSLPEEKVARPVHQKLLGPMDKDAQRETLMTLPGVGEKLAQELIDYAGTLNRCIECVTDYNVLSLQYKPKGLGKGTIQRNREWFGLAEGEYITTLVEDEHAENSLDG